MTDLIATETHGALCIIRLNRPQALNALSLDMLMALRAALVGAFADDQVNSIWLESTSERAFCAGGDVKALAIEVDGLRLDIEKAAKGREYFALEYSLDLLIEQSPKPIVAFAQGYVFGGGWGLFAGANLKLCTAQASFSMPENQIGFFPDVGAANFLQRAGWKQGTFIALAGLCLSALEAMALDYVDDVISPDYAQILQRQLAEGIDVTELDIASAEQTVNQLHEQWQQAMDCLPEEATLSDWMQIICDQQAQFDAFERACQQWLTASPWSLAFTWHYFQRQRQKTRAQVLEGETQIAAHFCTEVDFYQGVHAKLIHKGAQPQWQYEHIETVPLQHILRVIDPSEQESH